MLVIQKDLDKSKCIHNNNRIRRYPNQECSNGNPEMLYNVPELYGEFKSIQWRTGKQHAHTKQHNFGTFDFEILFDTS